MAAYGRSYSPIDDKDVMAQSTLDSEIRSRIDSFVEQLSALVKKAALDSVHAALGDGGAPVRRGPGRPRMKVSVGRTSKGSLGKRSSEQVEAMAAKIAAFVRSKPGSRLEQIASGLGTSSKELKLPVIKLLASKTLTKKGQKRGTTYFAGSGSGSSGGGKRSKKK